MITSVGAGLAWREALRRGNRDLVMTNGCFDLLHVGHIQSLEWARAQGDALLVILNSDEAIRQLKGRSRPILPFSQRAAMIAALRCVDRVICAEDPRLPLLIEAFSPDIYVKGGDYCLDSLDAEEKAKLYAVGAKILFAPNLDGYSTTALLRRIEDQLLIDQPRYEPARITTLFLDRDGVLSEERGHVTRPADLLLIPSAIEAVAQLQKQGIRCVVCTNQSAVGRGMIDTKVLDTIHGKLTQTLAQRGAQLLGTYAATWYPGRDADEKEHHSIAGWWERKPQPGLIAKAARELNLNLSECALVGDSTKDLEAANAARIPFYAVRSSKAHELPAGTQLFETLMDVAEELLRPKFAGA